MMISNAKRETTHDKRNRTVKSRENQNAKRKGIQQKLGNIERFKLIRFKQICGDKRKKKEKIVSQKNEKASRDKTILQESFQMDKYLGSPPRKILLTILEVDQRNWTKDLLFDSFYTKV